MTSINAYSVSLSMNASGFIDSSKLSRSELSSLTREMKSLESPAEKMERSINTLDNALSKGAITAEAHAEAIRRLGDRYETTAVKVNPVAESIKGVVKAWLGFEAVSRGAGALKDAADRADTLVTKSNALSESVPNIQRFEFALSQVANIDSERANQFLDRLNKVTGQAQLGGKSAIETFDRLGLSSSKLATMMPVERFMEVAKALSHIKDTTLQTALANEVFGKSGADLLPILNGNVEATREAMEAADRYGFVMTQNAAESAANANDAFERLSLATEGLANSFMSSLAPSIQNVTDLLSANESRLTSVIAKSATFTTTFQGEVFPDILRALNGWDASGSTPEAIRNRMEAVRRLRSSSIFSGIISDSLAAEADAYFQRLEESKASLAGNGLSQTDAMEAMTPTLAPQMWNDLLEKEKFLRGQEMSILEKREEVLNKEAKLNAPEALTVGSSGAYKFFVERQTAEQQRQANATAKAEALAKQQIDATKDVKQAVDNLAANIKRKR